MSRMCMIISLATFIAWAVPTNVIQKEKAELPAGNLDLLPVDGMKNLLKPTNAPPTVVTNTCEQRVEQALLLGIEAGIAAKNNNPTIQNLGVLRLIAVEMAKQARR